MREILFRGKNKKGEWVEGAYYKQTKFYGDDFEAHYIISSTDELEDNMMFVDRVLPKTVGQYTGLRDCKRTDEYPEGQMIFEGDIVNIEYLETTVKSTVIEYIGASFYGSTFADAWELDEYNQLEVIGNIHDNPELLKGEGYGTIY